MVSEPLVAEALALERISLPLVLPVEPLVLPQVLQVLPTLVPGLFLVADSPN